MADGCTHLLCNPTTQNVAEVTGGHSDVDDAAQFACCFEVVHNLGHNAGPVDAVDCRQVVRLTKWCVVEHRLHQILAIIEGAVDRHSAHIGRINRGHLTALHVAHTTMRIQDDDVDVGAMLHTINCGSTCITTCCTNNRDFFIALREDVIEQASEKLQCDILERKCRPVK